MAVSTGIIALVTAVLAFAGGLVSSYLMFRGQRIVASVQDKTANTEQVETIFSGYSQMVEDLQQEIARMRETIDELKAEQEACEERNRALERDVVQLKQRIVVLEKGKASGNAF